MSLKLNHPPKRGTRGEFQRIVLGGVEYGLAGDMEKLTDDDTWFKKLSLQRGDKGYYIRYNDEEFVDAGE